MLNGISTEMRPSVRRRGPAGQSSARVEQVNVADAPAELEDARWSSRRCRSTGSRTIDRLDASRLRAEQHARQVHAVAADVVQRAAAGIEDVPDVGGIVVVDTRTSSARPCSVPIRPDATSSRTATHDGWRRYMNASMSWTPARSARLDHPLGVGARSVASGFSHRTCLPASAAAIAHWRAGGSGAGCTRRRRPGRRGAPRTSRAPSGCRALRGHALGERDVARGDGDDLAVLGLLDAGDDLGPRDGRGRENSPAQPSVQRHRQQSRGHRARRLDRSVLTRTVAMDESTSTSAPRPATDARPPAVRSA